MGLFSTIPAMAVAIALIGGLPLQSDEVIYRTPSGDLSVIDVDVAHSFDHVVSMIRAEIIADCAIEELYAAATEKKPNGADYVLDFKMLNDPKANHPIAKGAMRSYAAPLLPEEKKEISSVIETLGNSSLISIAKAKSSLERAGKEVEHVHPLQFLAYIFSTEKLKAAVHNMRSRSWVWGRFFKGLKTGLDEEASRQNVLPYIRDFSSRIGIDAKILFPLAEKKQWKDFVEALLSEVPRSGNSGRYDM